ncbi:uncharacterized protein LOC136005795 isoform X4 [Lathamus discolor]|uniref:uncharacterized protein LOC136005795 isoform X4 n=1 Tax=Lathamus discolor TaxID=678569 RepID=UPI0032B844C6
MLLGCCFKSHAAFICSCKEKVWEKVRSSWTLGRSNENGGIQGKAKKASEEDRADNRGNSQNQESAVREDHGGRSYQQSVTTLEKIQEYGKEHVKACELWERSQLGLQNHGLPTEHAVPLGSRLRLSRGSGLLSDPFRVGPADLPELNAYL